MPHHALAQRLSDHLLPFETQLRTKTKHGKEIWKHTKPTLNAHALNYRITHLKEVTEWQKPEGMKVIGLVFYGRQRYASILQYYLQVRTGSPIPLSSAT